MAALPLRLSSIFFLSILLIPAGFAQLVPGRYAVVLQEAPVVARYSSAAQVRTADAASYRGQIEARQRTLRSQFAERGIQVHGATRTLLNAIFVSMPEGRVAEVRAMAGVAGVVPLRRYKRAMNRAADLVNASTAWASLGGQSNGGAGVKIAILDTGIDHTHPSFQDPSLPVPAGYPKCDGADCNFTNNKIIAARSYTKWLAAGTNLADPAADSRPDDLLPRDREGHGTGVASAAAGVVATGAVTVSGIAPKAYLGNYKIYGSPEVNDYTNDEAIIRALEDAVDDGMDIVSFSTGGVAFTGPLDSGSACGNDPGVPCDLSATAFENAAKAGTIVVVAAGNEGTYGSRTYPTYQSISSPANAPSVISVGASSNSHYFSTSVGATAADAPANLKGLPATPSYDGNGPYGAVIAPLVDVETLGDDGLACAALPAGSLEGKFALIKRGTCVFSTKTYFATSAGAVGIVFYMADDTPLISPQGMSAYYGSFAMVSLADGLALKSYLESNPGAEVMIDPSGTEKEWQYVNELAYFSSRGPTTGDALLKPDLVAPGEDIYVATQRYDPLGFMHSDSRFLSASGTSFATPLVSGAAALVRQKNPGFTAEQVKSALVNTAAQDVLVEEYFGDAVDVRSVGNGKLNAGDAISAPVTVAPVSLSFGEVTNGTLPLSRMLRITNASPGAVDLTLALAPAGTILSLDKNSLTLAPGASDTVTATLSGAVPAPGAYSGALTVQGPGVSLRVPYLYLVADGTPANLIGLSGGSDGTVGRPIPEGYLSFRAVDGYGLPVRGLPVTWRSNTWGAQLIEADDKTDNYGVSYARPVLGDMTGYYNFTAEAGTVPNRLTLTYSVYARPVPTISGVVNSASFEAGAPVAPGSYVSFFGSGLSDSTRVNKQSRLPLAMNYAFASFDVPSAGISVPGRLTYASPGQVNVQVPWELQGQGAAQVKMTIGDSYGNVITVPLSDFAPAFFETSAGIAAALDAENKVVTTANAVERGKVVQLFLNGLGPVTNQPASGEPALASPLSETLTTPVVTIGGVVCPVAWSGLTPTLPGLYQINVTLPVDLGTGTLPVTVAIGGVTSKASGLPVR